MIKQTKRESRNVNDYLFIKSERRRIEMLNRVFFSNVELTKDENSVLVWLCGWDEYTINNIVSAFKKINRLEESKSGKR